MAALWSLIAVAVFASTAVVANADLGPGLALVALLGWVVSLPVSWPVNRERRLSDVALLAGCIFFLTFGLRSVVLLLRSQPELPGPPDQSVLAALAGFLPIHFDVLLLAIVCWVAFTIGYRVPVGSALADRLGDSGLGRVRTGTLAALVCLLASAGWAARLVSRAGRPLFERVDPGAVEASETLLTWFTLLAPTALVLALLGVVHFRRHAAFIVLGAALMLGEVMFAVIVGNRAPLFSVALATVALGVVRPAKPGRWLFALVPIALVIFGATAVYRAPQVFSESRIDDPMQRLLTTLDQSVELGPVGLAEVGLWNVSARYIGVDSVAQVLLVGPPDPTWGERYLLAVPSALVPRFLWPDKPNTSIAIEFAHTYHDVPGEVIVSYAPTWVADLLLSFPLLFVPAGMLVIGVACRVLNEYGRRAQAGRSFGLVPYALILPIAVQSDAWISFGLYQLTQIIVISVAIALVLGVDMRVREPSKTRAPTGGTRSPAVTAKRLEQPRAPRSAA